MANFTLTDKQKEILQALNEKQYRHICLYGGGRSGKTTFLMFIIFMRALKEPNSFHVIIRDTHTSMKSSIFEQTITKLLSFDNFKDLKNHPDLKKNKQDLTITFPNGSIIYCYGLNTENAVERILGNEYSTIYYNECSSLDYSRITPLRSRLAQKTSLNNKFFYDFNPPLKTHWTYKYFIEQKDPIMGHELPNKDEFYLAKVNPIDNLTNIDEFYLKEQEYAGSEHKKRFVDGDFQDEIKGALFTASMIDAANQNNLTGKTINEIRNILSQIVIGIDPAVTTSDTSDKTGIVVCGSNGYDFFVLEDKTGHYKPIEWAGIIYQLYDKWSANAVIVETNQGGDLLRENIKSFGQRYGNNRYLNIQEVRAVFGKRIRAEPIATLYARNKVKHIQYFAENQDDKTQGKKEQVHGLLDLQYEMLSFTGDKNQKSPDRLDALVHGLQYLTPDDSNINLLSLFQSF